LLTVVIKQNSKVV